MKPIDKFGNKGGKKMKGRYVKVVKAIPKGCNGLECGLMCVGKVGVRIKLRGNYTPCRYAIFRFFGEGAGGSICRYAKTCACLEDRSCYVYISEEEALAGAVAEAI